MEVARQEQARQLAVLPEEDPLLDSPQPAAPCRARGCRLTSAGSLSFLAVAALAGAGCWLWKGTESRRPLSQAQLPHSIGQAEGKIASDGHEALRASARHHSHGHRKATAGASHSREPKRKIPATTLTTTTSTTEHEADGGDNPLQQIQHWPGWEVVFPWITTVTSTTTTTTTTTTTYTGTTTRTTTTTSTTTNTTTTTTSTTPCQAVADGDACYLEIVGAMHGLRANPEAYENLTLWSTFEEVQSWLHRGGSSECTLPCECETTQYDDSCYGSVEWAFTTGMQEHPDWYPDMDQQTPLETIQAHVAKYGDECGQPCRPRYTAERTSLFCFSITRPDGYERAVMEAQHARGAGIFGCDGHAVLSSKVFSIGEPDPDRPDGPKQALNTTLFHPAKVGVSKDGTAANTLLFMHAWDVVKNKTLALHYNWVIKADPDAVILPDRLRKHLSPFDGSKTYVRNCNAVPESADFPMMFGSLEVLSSLAMKEYFHGGEHKCKEQLDWKSWGEDYFLGKCMLLLGVAPVDNFNIISDGVCMGVDCTDSTAAAFHPFKSADEWVTCWKQATRDGHMSLVPLPEIAS
ncbi:unnamed protein product [Prorocentrum cordatum]|uniref:Hexosyltransferase n=1 Tax=Prorocentrum cordatum TaxID=2364126 RepID=A0ABN9TXP4_9DINO|nr:unnamed protein product [Polarella glacialis]